MRNYYKHTIDLKKLEIRNDRKENFIQNKRLKINLI